MRNINRMEIIVNKNSLQELKDFENELIKNFEDRMSALVLVEVINTSVLKEAQDCITETNKTESYDEKVKNLVAGIQGMVKIVTQYRNVVFEETKKHENDLELLKKLQVRFSDFEEMEKKIE